MSAFWHWGDPVAPLLATLRRGGVLAIPTESSYGLAVDPASPAGVAAVYRIKHREAGKPLPVVIAEISQLAAWGIDTDLPALQQVAAHWPAPLSVLLPLSEDLPAAAGSGQLAVRVPDHPALCRLLAELGTGLTATSANASGEPPILDPAELPALLAEADAVIVDGGLLPGGPPSTLVQPAGQGFTVLRPGRFAAERLGSGTMLSA